MRRSHPSGTLGGILGSRRSLLALAVFVPAAVAVAVPIVRRTFRAEVTGPSLVKLSGSAARTAAEAPPPPSLTGIDLTKIEVKDQVSTAPLPNKRTAKLAVDPSLQRVAERVMSMHHLPEAVVVMMDVETGKVIAYASHVDKGPKRDLAVEATAPQRASSRS